MENPQFSYSVAFPFGIGLCLVFCGVTLAIVFLFPPIDVVWESMMTIVALAGIYVIYKNIKARVRSATFYENRFKVSGWKYKKEFPYAMIDDVTFVKGVINEGSITIALKDEEDPLVIQANPKNRWLKMDLNTWLIRKKNEEHSKTG